MNHALVKITARYPDGEEVVINVLAKDGLQGAFVSHLLRSGMSTLGFGGAVQVVADGATVGMSVSAPPCPTGYMPPAKPWWPTKPTPWWLRIFGVRGG